MITLEANSDEENAKVKRRKESSNDKLAHKDSIHAYFGKPFHQPGDLTRRGSLYPMISAMIKKTDGILQEALGCETLVMATILNPAFRLRFFSKHFGPTSSKFQEAEAVLDKNFDFYLESFPTKPKSSNHYPSFRRVESGTSRWEFFSEVFSDHEEDDMGADKQLQDYFQGVIKMKAPEYDCEDPAAALLWWQVSIIH